MVGRVILLVGKFSFLGGEEDDRGFRLDDFGVMVVNVYGNVFREIEV